MKEYNQKVYLVIIQQISSNHDFNKDNIKVIPCKTKSSAKEFEKFYREKISEDELGAIDIIESNLYGD